MGWYKCRSCGHEYNSGFFTPKWCNCPKCWGKFSQIGKIIKIALKVLIPVFIVMFIIKNASLGTYNNIRYFATSVLDSTTLYTYSKDAYMERIIYGQRSNQYYVITKPVPYYSSIVPNEKLETEKPMGGLSAKVVVELGRVIRRGANVWIPVSFYIKEKPQKAFALFPREWEENVTVYNWNEKVGKIQAEYESTVIKNFQLMEVAPEDEKVYKEKYNDYFKVKGIGKKTFFYAPKTDKSKIEAIYSYYLNWENINMVILQADTTWNRPAIEIKKTEDGK